MKLFGKAREFFKGKKSKKRVAILIIDDDIDFADSLKATMNELGFDCDIITHPKEAYKMLDENYYEIVFCDVIMPNFDLKTFLSYMGKRFPSIGFIVISGIDLKELRKSFLWMANVKTVLSKPVCFDKMKEILQTL